MIRTHFPLLSLLFLTACVASPEVTELSNTDLPDTVIAPEIVLTPTTLATNTATVTVTPTGTPVPTGTPIPTDTIVPTSTFSPTSSSLPPTAVPSQAAWQSFSGQGFELEYPADWTFFGPDGIECAALYHFFPSSLMLIRFFACWEENVGGNMLTLPETYARFRGAFTANALIDYELINEISIEIIQYNQSGDDGIYRFTDSPGTIALWQSGDSGWALVDEGNQNQQNQIFARILYSFKFNDEE